MITIKPETGEEVQTAAIISPFAAAAGIPAFISLETLAALTGIRHEVRVLPLECRRPCISVGHEISVWH